MCHVGPWAPIPQAFHESAPFGRVGVGLSRAIGPLELFGEADTIVGPFGAEARQYIEGLVPDGRKTGFDVGATAGLRLGVL